MHNFLNRFEIAFSRLCLIFAGCTAVSIALFAILIPLDLFIRSIGWGNMPWLHEGIEYALYAGVFLGAPWALQQGAHVRVDLIVAHLPKNLAVSAEILLDFVGCVICVVLFYYGLQGSIEAYVDKSIPDKLLKIDNWWMVSIFSASFFMLAIEFLLRMRRARTVFEKEKTISTEAGF